MKTPRSGRFFGLLILTALLLTACQIASIEITKHTDEPDEMMTPLVEAATNAPISKPTRAISQTAPTEEGSVPPSAEMQVPEGWQVFKDPTRGYSLAFPPESKPKVPGSPRPDYISYSRLPDQTVAGLAAPVIENSKLWGMPVETKERIVLMVTEDTTYILGMYYDTPDQLALFEQVIDRFQFLP